MDINTQLEYLFKFYRYTTTLKLKKGRQYINIGLGKIDSNKYASESITGENASKGGINYEEFIGKRYNAKQLYKLWASIKL